MTITDEELDKHGVSKGHKGMTDPFSYTSLLSYPFVLSVRLTYPVTPPTTFLSNRLIRVALGRGAEEE